MSKIKTPFLSLGASGSIGDTLTLQRRGATTLVRTKPTPAYRYTLLQAYQRWLYEDYAYLWTQQSQATRQEYATAGSRHHLTGFQYWMKYCLTSLPWIAGMWYLDEKAGAIAYDSSKQQHNLAIIGASPAPGLINGGSYFDGINDYLTTPAAGSLVNFTAKTVEFFVKPTPFTIWARPFYFCGMEPPDWGDMIRFKAGSNSFDIWLINPSLDIVSFTIPYTPGVNTHLAYTWDGALVIPFKDGEQVHAGKPLSGILDCSATPLRLGTENLANFWEFNLDHLIIYRRALDPTEIKRHSERRYPV